MDRAKEPTKARFDVGEYDDGSGPVATVSYDATAGATASMIWVETSSDQWIAFDWQHADELCAAIQRCAAMLRALAQPAPQSPPQGGSN